MRKSEISASMMCANLVTLKETISIFEHNNIDFLHIDVMDGTFVPNFGLGVDYIRGLRDLTNIPLDIHLMVKDPEYKFQWIGIRPSDSVCIHYESTFQVQRALDYLVPFGCKRFLALNPATPVYVLEEVLDYIDGINVLMVNPGYAGQKIVPSTINKAQKIVDLLKQYGRSDLIVEVDGNITPENGKLLKAIGANRFVAGTSSLFKGNINDMQQNIDNLKQHLI